MTRSFFTAFWLIVFAAFILPSILHAQEWRRVESGVTEELYDVFFVNNNVGWVAGNDSVLLKTTDGGETWFRQNPYIGARSAYNSIWFNDENNGWAAGAQAGGISLILHTKDGGETWNRQYCDANSVYDIQFTTPDTGYLVTGQNVDERIYRTTNGGNEWIALGDNLSLQMDLGEFKSLSFVSNTEGWIGGTTSYMDPYNKRLIFHTTNGGDTWEEQYPSTGGPTRKISFLNENFGIATGVFGVTLITTNGGQDWEAIMPIDGIQPINGIALFILDPDHIYMVESFGSTFYLDWLSDTAKSLQRMDVPDMDAMKGLFFTDAAHGWAVGRHGKIWVYGTQGTGINEVDKVTDFTMRAYPNPAGLKSGYGNNLTIEIESEVHEGTPNFEMVDILGRSTSIAPERSGTTTGLILRLDVSNIRTGMYFVRARNDDSKRISVKPVFIFN